MHTRSSMTLFVAVLLAACSAEDDDLTPVAVTPSSPSSPAMDDDSASTAVEPPMGTARSQPEAVVRAPTASDLAAYTDGIRDYADVLQGRKGELRATIVTNFGLIKCELYEDRTPRTVANFVGLARGLHPWLDPVTKRARRGPLYDDTTIHRVVKGFVIQGGDPTGTGRGGPGYRFDDEIDPDLKFDRPGRLAMANSGKDTNGSQFFITLGAFPHLDGRNTIFGQCETAIVNEIASVGVAASEHGERSHPTAPIVIQEIRFRRE